MLAPDSDDEVGPRVIYDLSRLPTRTLTATPNGIDRIDLLLANNLLTTKLGEPLIFGLCGPRLRGQPEGLKIVVRLREHWDEVTSSRTDEGYGTVARALKAKGSSTFLRIHRASLAKRLAAAASELARLGLSGGLEPVKHAPRSAIYLNATHFPVEWRRHTRWLDARPDIRPVLFVHDVLPITRPNLFWDGEPSKHRQRLEFLARRGSGALVTSGAVAEALREVMGGLGRADLPILQARPPVLPIFQEATPPDSSLGEHPYFIACGTIEPRKNYAMLAAAWRGLRASLGERAPRLVVVGKRGWSYHETVRLLHDPAIGGSILEVSGLATPAYRRLLASARALLAPAIDEGYGLTWAEAVSAGIPVIASDIPSHRESAADFVILCRPAVVADWVDAVRSLCPPGSAHAAAVARAKTYVPPSIDDYISRIRGFLQSL